MADRERFSPPVVGGTSLLVIFAVLALTVFALLSLSTALANDRLSSAAAQAVYDYYQADCQAEAILAQLRQGRQPPGVARQGDVFAYSCPISDTQTLLVEVRLDGDAYTVLRWQAVSTAPWHPDDSLNLWDGG
ncbi:hypothetical protein [Pseudoflavonifractor phocaeensis]|uniref:hypothetical protein n=1 Tax=Pseudoflavonifractor phocaeensis TaxID=1870988 RepID=UPI001F46701B|nr:hypothetical protein [Pseudoflavonifractor phocaeensis]MCF2595244.1 hypothetical protein [Pseudoflavonifractor phocaeensis]